MRIIIKTIIALSMIVSAAFATAHNTTSKGCTVGFYENPAYTLIIRDSGIILRDSDKNTILRNASFPEKKSEDYISIGEMTEGKRTFNASIRFTDNGLIMEKTGEATQLYYVFQKVYE